MIIYKTAADTRRYVQKAIAEKQKTGFVPTMGALHSGHLSLIETAKKENDLTIASIFINPSQFNNPEDFRLYPVTIEKDIELLIGAGCDVLFLPSVSEIYPKGYTAPHYDLGDLETVLEGKFRPGHFQGVCQVVDRLLDIVSSSRLYLGNKDYQQCMVISRLRELRASASPEIVIGATVRESDGLAMSSRNARLSKEQRKVATVIYETLLFMKEQYGNQPADRVKSQAVEMLRAAGFEVDYAEIADAKTLRPVSSSDNGPIVALIAASIGNIRLIDNILLS